MNRFAKQQQARREKQKSDEGFDNDKINPVCTAQLICDIGRSHDHVNIGRPESSPQEEANQSQKYIRKKEKLQLSSLKCNNIYIGKGNKICQTLKVHGTKMKSSNQEIYL